mmetsp:Transcript_28306/g.74902  ORF Transcript_28306/g.74902 Transcript_28306/m.74902 type:complete len:398 (+) Transcript_28306:39-1232(+)
MRGSGLLTCQRSPIHLGARIPVGKLGLRWKNTAWGSIGAHGPPMEARPTLPSSHAPPSSHVHAAVHVQHLPRDVPGAGCGEEQDGIGDLLRIAKAAGRHGLQELVLPLLLEAVGHVRGDEAGGQGVHGDAAAADLPGEGAGEAVHAGLGRGVVGLARVAHGADHRRDADDAAPPVLGHGLEDGLGHAEDGVEVGVDDIVPLGVLHAHHKGVLGDAGVVDENVDLAVLSLDDLQHGGDLGTVDDVELHARARLLVAEASGDGRGAGVGGRGADHDGARGRELLGDGFADAARRTRHEGDLAGEVEVGHAGPRSRLAGHRRAEGRGSHLARNEGVLGGHHGRAAQGGHLGQHREGLAALPNVGHGAQEGRSNQAPAATHGVLGGGGWRAPARARKRGRF